MIRTKDKSAALAASIKRLLAAALATATLLASGCAQQQPTVVEFSVPPNGGTPTVINDVVEEGGLTFIEIRGYTTPEPIVTPAPTAVPTEKPKEPARTHRPKETEKPKEDEPKATSTPKPSKAKSPYADKYSKVSIEYTGSSTPIEFATITLKGDAVSQKIFSRQRLTMINLWTMT